MNYSKTYTAAIAGLLAFLLRSADLEVHDEELLVFVTNTVQAVAFVVVMYGRWKAGGVTWHGVKK
jgi:hypothetical protein